MSRRIGKAKACIVVAVLGGTALFSTGAFAQQGCCEGGTATGANMWTAGNPTSDQWPPNPPPAVVYPTSSAGLPVKAPPPQPLPVPYWWTHGDLEIGGRGFVGDHDRDGSLRGNSAPANIFYLGQHSLAKYNEYSGVMPGVFGGGHAAMGSSDGLYQVDLWANNVGYDDQSYLLTANKIGEHYFTAQWDQTPHLYSTNAQTPFAGIGSAALSVPFKAPLAGASGIIPFLQQTDLGIHRDTASASYRWTPTEAWDVNANYSHMERYGTQSMGIVEMKGFSETQVPAPVDDTTQNFGTNGEYAGTSPWGQRFTFKAGYNGSVYTDNISSFTAQNPYFPTLASCTKPTATAEGTANCVSAQMSTPPNNAANGFSSTATADLPFQSHYAGTFSYTKMTQNSAFQPMTNNPLAALSPNGAPWNSIAALPTNSLNGDINTLLSNNVITTKITPELTSKLSYRYYDFDNGTPQITFPCWIHYDGTGTSPSAGNPCGPAGFEDSISSLSPGYIKQNAGAELNWRPNQQWTVNAGYGFERYNYTEVDVNVTNESSAKLSADWKPTNWLTARASGYYSDRRYDTYDYVNFVRNIQFPTLPPFTAQSGSWFYSPAYRQFMFDNRQRTKADFAIDIVAFRGVTVTPTVKYKDDYYGLNPLNQEGVDDNKSISTGVDLGYVVTPDLSFAFSYYWENYNQLLYSNTGNGTPTTGQGLIVNSDKEHVNTITAAMSWAAIPSKLNVDLHYAVSDGVDMQNCSQCIATGAVTPSPFPNETTLFQRLDATATYRFDPVVVSQLGFAGELKAKLRYSWERNSVSNWQNDPMAAFTPAVSSTAIWLTDNPNYNVQMLAASLIASW